MNRSAAPPEKLYGESSKTFRLRAVYWIIKHFADMSYDTIVAKYNELYGPDQQTTKESVVRDLKVLEERGEIDSDYDGEDRRRRIWYVVE